MILLGILLCLVFSGFFSGMETGLVAANQLEIYARREKKLLYARAAHFLLHKPDRLLATTLIGNNLVNVTATVLVIHLIRLSPLPSYAEWVGVFV